MIGSDWKSGVRFSANDKAKKVLIGGTTGDGTTTSTPSRARM